MNGFTKATRDPKPWVDTEDGERSEDARFWPWADYAPRPEYDHHNPILVLTRRIWPAPARDGAEGILGWRDGVLTGPDYTEAQKAHARRILTKLAILGEAPDD